MGYSWMPVRQLSGQSHMARNELYHNLSNRAKLPCQRLECQNWRGIFSVSVSHEVWTYT